MSGLGDNSRQVVCVCGGFGYPQGAGSSARITLVGRALQTAGIGFQVLHCGPSPTKVNTERSGVHEGIPFEYTTSLARPRNTIPRLLVYARAVVGLTRRLWRLRRQRDRTVVYLYVMTGPLHLYVSTLCRRLGLPVVQEMCEWWPGEPTCSRLTRWLYRGPMFTSSTGMLVISNAIEQRAREIAAQKNPELRICRLPSVVDLERFSTAKPAASRRHNGVPHFVWCGSIDGWLNDVLFLLRVMARIRLSHACQLTIVGSYSERSRDAVRTYAEELGLPLADGAALNTGRADASRADILLRGWVDDDALRACYHSAAALLLPLWDDDRSRTRMPNKLPEYLASGRPVITCRVGDLTDFLIDNVNACVGEPGDEQEFAANMMAVLDYPEHANQIGAAGRQACAGYFDYRAHIPALAEFFDNCMHRRRPLPVESQVA